jgi:hypothetical protein
MNAVVKPESVETIFDYELSAEEREVLTFGLSESEYLRTASQEGLNMGLAALFGMRGDNEKSKVYLNKLDQDFVKLNVYWDSLRAA